MLARLLGLTALKEQARQTARTGAFLSAAALFLLVGVGCLTAAVWLALAAAKGAIFAAVIVGLIYLGIGLVLVAIALQRDGKSAHAADDPHAETLEAAAEAAARRAAAMGQSVQGETEKALRGLLGEFGLTPPAPGSISAPAMAAAFVLGLTSAIRMSRRR